MDPTEHNRESPGSSVGPGAGQRLACGQCIEYALDEYIDQTGCPPDLERVSPERSGRTAVARCDLCGAPAAFRLVSGGETDATSHPGGRQA